MPPRVSGEASAVKTEAQVTGADSLPDDQLIELHKETPANGSVDAQPQAKPGPVVEIDLEDLACHAIVTPNTSNTMLMEQFRMVKQPLLMRVASRGKDALQNSNLIMIASAVPSEGKTSVSISLAMSIAMEHDKTVLLVDADVMKDDVSRRLGITVEKGLSDYLALPDSQLSEYLVKTNVPTLTVLPAGRRHPNITEFLGSDGMGRLIRELSTRYEDRIVIFDSPPILSSAGAAILAPHMGQILVVVAATSTSQAQVAEALRILGPTENVGLILNKIRHSSVSGYGYGYSYGYGYGYGYGRAQDYSK